MITRKSQAVPYSPVRVSAETFRWSVCITLIETVGRGNVDGNRTTMIFAQLFIAIHGDDLVVMQSLLLSFEGIQFTFYSHVRTNSLVNSMLGLPAPAVDSSVTNCESDVCIVLNASTVENTCLLCSVCMDSDSVVASSRDREARRGSRRFSISRDIIVDDILNRVTSDTQKEVRDVPYTFVNVVIKPLSGSCEQLNEGRVTSLLLSYALWATERKTSIEIESYHTARI